MMKIYVMEIIIMAATPWTSALPEAFIMAAEVHKCEVG